VLHKTLCRILGCALLSLSCGSAALAFTLIEIPQEQTAPSSSVSDSLTLQTQVQPIASTIRAQILGHLRPKGSKKATQVGGMMLAANAQASSIGDVNLLAAAASDAPPAGSGGGSGNSESVWISTAINSLENDFSRTAFYGVTQNLLSGFDLTRSNKYVAGVSLGYEASNFTTKFNTGTEKTRGFNINPYFAWLLSDAWSLDLILGYGDFDTRQTRAVPVLAVPLTTGNVNSDFSSKRGLASTNLTNVSTFGDWKLTGSLGFLWSRRENDAYVESDGTAVAKSKQTLEQWNLLGEAAYGRGNSETFFGALYESTQDIQKITFTSGEQPANDPSSVLLTTGWRYFAAKGLSANFAFSARVSQDQFKEQYGFSMLLRMDL
jgi:autotransporter-like protein